MRDRVPVAVTPAGLREPALAALAGCAAAACAIAASELVAGIVPGAPSLVVAIGALAISLQPAGAKDIVVSLFGTNDKLALNLFVVLVALAIAAAAGIVGRRSFRWAATIFVVVGGIAYVAATAVDLAPAALALGNVLLAVAVAVIVLDRMLRAGGLRAPSAASPAAPPTPAPDRRAMRSRDPRATAIAMPAWSRRRFVLASAGLLGASAVVGGFGRYLLDRGHPTGTPVSATLPPATEPAPALTADESIAAPGITPIVVSNDDFYRIDTALLVPQVDASTWQLKVTGMVDRPLQFSYPELLAMPLFEQYVTIACVSNTVGGNLVGNTVWTGVHLKAILAMAGIKPGATQIVGRSVDGFTVGFPTSWALDPAREPMIALGMNREPLPAAHGYPARLIVPGLYGYVSATKWLSEIELTTREAFDGYWIDLGWAKDGPILTQSRIDNPADGSTVPAGTVQVDGLAWAPDRGITKVEISVDGGPWQQAELSRAISKATWVRWVVGWQATKGQHTIAVRATDGTSTVQTAESTPPAPDGARGHHRISVTVS